MPEQTVFHPDRSLHTDKVSVGNLIHTAAITFCEGELDDLNPTYSMSFDMQKESEVKRLNHWIAESDTILGMNILFDLMYLRKFNSMFRLSLSEKRLIDLQILNYLHDETRPEKSLKDLGPVLRTHKYTGLTAQNHRFKGSKDQDLHYYNVLDTHNTVLAYRELVRRIIRDFPGTAKASEYCLDFYSDVLWSVLRMSEDGIPMDINYLEQVESDAQEKIQEALEFCTNHDLLLEGTGSANSKQEFMNLLCDTIGGDIREHPMLEYTQKTKQISYNDNNRNLLSSKLPSDSPLVDLVLMCKQHSSNQKILSSYCYPLLRHRRNRPDDQSSKIIGGRVYPTWYITGGRFSEGGTLQGRITCKRPSAQTFPPIIKKGIQTRTNAIVAFDLSQIELRVAALLSGDDALCSAYLEDMDLHAERASQIFGKKQVTNDERQVGKCINFADLFRSGSDTMQSTVLSMTGQNKPKAFFQEIVRTRKEHRPGLWKWQENVIDTCQTEGRYELPFIGQSRFFRGGDKYMVSEMVNFPVQTTASNTLLGIQNEMNKKLKTLKKPRYETDIRLLLNIYDALYFECPLNKVEELKAYFEEAVNAVQDELYWNFLCSTYKRRIPLKYDCEIRTPIQ